MKKLKPIKNKRKCIVCDGFLFGRSDKVFCDIKCKNKYHAELAKTQKTVAKETFKILAKNWTIITTIMASDASELHINKVELARHGFDFTTVSGIEIRTEHTRFSVFEYTWYHQANNEIRITLNKEQTPISPFIFKRWKNRYSENKYPTLISDINKMYHQRNST